MRPVNFCVKRDAFLLGSFSQLRTIIVQALYGLKSACAAFQAHLASFMHHMGYISCKADPDQWLKAMTRPDNNVQYYAYIL
jgi:hypothetical protein